MPNRTISKRHRLLCRVTYATFQLLLNLRKFFEKSALYDERFSIYESLTDLCLLHACKIAPPLEYAVQALADTFIQNVFHIKILFVPVRLPEVNPIELIICNMKREVSKSNFAFKW